MTAGCYSLIAIEAAKNHRLSDVNPPPAHMTCVTTDRPTTTN